MRVSGVSVAMSTTLTRRLGPDARDEELTEGWPRPQPDMGAGLIGKGAIPRDVER